MLQICYKIPVMRYFRPVIAIGGLLILFSAALRCEEPAQVTVCELKANPADYNHKLIEVIGFVSHGFEDFGLFDPSCSSWPYVWLEYGGTKKSGTMYCCGVSNSRTRPQELVVEGITVSLTTDETFDTFDKLIRPDSVVHATLIGRFFAGKESRLMGRGYGHMGCCSLLAIQTVVSVDSHDRVDLDYRSSPDQPNIEKAGCGYQDLVPPWPYADWVKAQQTADLKGSDSVFESSEQVAADALNRLANMDVKTLENLQETKRTQGRVIYELKTDDGETTYMIVLSKPYILSFYAKGPKESGMGCDRRLQVFLRKR